MEEVQSWWEVPAIAHFCCVFRATFNLIYFDVGELEAAILNMQDPELSISLEQLITRLLQGCFDNGEVTSINWEEKLSEILTEHDDDEENPLKGTSFNRITPRTKVEILLNLCQIRLDIAVSEDKIKDMPAEDMQAKCIGHDSDKFSYWYFDDERLYKENPLKTHGKSGKQISVKVKTETIPVKNGKRKNTRDKKSASTSDVDSSWIIVCHSLNDWENLVKKFSKSKSTSEKHLAGEIKTNYLEKISGIVAEKERLLRKRYLELAPKRTSSRISKVQAQRRLEEQRVAEAEDERRRVYEMKLAQQEAEKKKQEKESRSKRAEERSKIIEGRAKRAQQRGMMRNFIDDYEDSDSNDNFERTFRDRNKSSQSREHNTKEDNSSDSESQDSNDESENEEDCDKSEEQSSSEKADSEESDNNESESESSDGNENGNSVSANNTDTRQYIQQKVCPTKIILTKWNSTMDKTGNKLHLLRTPVSDNSGNKRFRIDEAGSYKVSSLNGFSSTTHKENQNLTPFQNRNLNTYGGVQQRQGIVRIDFIKPAPKQVSS